MWPNGQADLDHGEAARLVELQQLHVDSLRTVLINPDFIVVRVRLLLIIIDARQQLIDFHEVGDRLFKIRLLLLLILEAFDRLD